MANASIDPFVRDEIALRLARQLRHAVGRVGVEEFQSQDDQFDQDSRLGRELLYLASNDEWIRATRELVTLDAADTVGTSIQVHVDLGRITHEAFRNRLERIWLPLLVLPAPKEPVPGSPEDLADGSTVTPMPLVSDDAGAALPALPQSEARRWLAAALAEIILNMSPGREGDGQSVQPARELAREQRLLLSAALARLLQARAPHEIPETSSDLESPPVGPLANARHRLAPMLDSIIDGLAGPHRFGYVDRDALMMQRAGRIIHAVSNPTTLVVVAVPPMAQTGVYTVELASRPLATRMPRLRGPRASIEIDALLPGTEADRSIVVRLPQGVSFTGHDDPRLRPQSVRATVETAQPRSMRQVVNLIGQLKQVDGLLADPVARCLVDFTLARMEAAREASRHYRSSADEARRTAGGSGPVTVAGRLPAQPAEWLAPVHEALERVPVSSGVAEQARDVARSAKVDLGDADSLYRINESDAVSPRRAQIHLSAIENRNARTTPVGATVHLDVVADRSAPLHAARYAGYMSLLLLGAVLFCWIFIRRGRDSHDPDAQVLASVLTLFAAVQASRIQHPERSSLRGLLISSGSWLVIASILPTVLLGVTLAFLHSSTAVIVGAVAVQTFVQLLMYLPPLTGQTWRWRVLNDSLSARPPRLQLRTTPEPDYRRTAALLSSWWRTTTAAALQLGAEAHGYVVLQSSGGLLELLGDGDQAVPTPIPRTSVMARGLDFVATRLPKAVLAGLSDEPQRPANILAMLRVGSPPRALSFIVFREEPHPNWQPDRVAVDLVADRLIANEAPVAKLDVFIGLARHGLHDIADHPVGRFLALAERRRLQVRNVRFPAPPPEGGSPDRNWTWATIGIRSNEVADLAELLQEISDTVARPGDEGVDLLVDTSTPTPPRHFAGDFVDELNSTVDALRPSGLDVRRALPDAGGDWVTLAMCDRAQDGVESTMLKVMESDHPGLELAGLTMARLFGTTVIFALGRQPRELLAEEPSGAQRGAMPLVEAPTRPDELGSPRDEGVLLDVDARYSDRPGIFTSLVEALRQNIVRAVGNGFPGAAIDVPYVRTAVADGRHATASLTLSLPSPAVAAHFTPEALDRIEREARRTLTSRYETDPDGDDLGLVHAPRVSISIELVTVRRARSAGPVGTASGTAHGTASGTASATDLRIDLDDGEGQPVRPAAGAADSPG